MVASANQSSMHRGTQIFYLLWHLPSLSNQKIMKKPLEKNCFCTHRAIFTNFRSEIITVSVLHKTLTLVIHTLLGRHTTLYNIENLVCIIYRFVLRRFGTVINSYSKPQLSQIYPDQLQPVTPIFFRGCSQMMSCAQGGGVGWPKSDFSWRGVRGG